MSFSGACIKKEAVHRFFFYVLFCRLYEVHEQRHDLGTCGGALRIKGPVVAPVDHTRFIHGVDGLLRPTVNTGIVGESAVASVEYGQDDALPVDVIVKELKGGDKVTLMGFGTFELKKKAAREGINPLTKKPIKIAASNVPAFKLGGSFKDLFN